MNYYLPLLIFIILLGAGCQKKSKQPNVILFLADDLGYGDLGCYGATDISTPNIDKLAEQGVKFTDFYANGPECTPTRTALLSGCYQQRVGGLECAIGAGNVGRYDDAIWLAERRDLGLPTDKSVLPQSLKSAGYATSLFGKWHLGYEVKFRPDKHGFDYSFGPIGFGGDFFYHVEQGAINIEGFADKHNLAENGKEVFYDGQYMTGLITDKAINWLKKQDKDNPFFMYLPFTAPHSPYQGPNDDLGRPINEEEWKYKSRDTYIEMVQSMDSGIGEILTVLDDMKLDRETVVIFFSDNGANSVGDNGILSGFKGNVYEGGIRVPCIIRWPGKIKANEISGQVAMSMDLSYSILNLAEVHTQDLKLDGIDIVNHVLSENEDFDRTVYWRGKRHNKVRKAVRDGDMKYLIILDKDSVMEERLFNLKVDPSELVDLLDSLPKETMSLKAKVSAWEKDVSVQVIVPAD